MVFIRCLVCMMALGVGACGHDAKPVAQIPPGMVVVREASCAEGFDQDMRALEDQMAATQEKSTW